EIDKTSISEMFLQKLSDIQINIDTIDKNYVRDFPKERLLKLNVSNVKENQIEEGIRKVIEKIKQSERLNFQFKKE
ncbi:PLP-dependent aminotransferase family protein, partial [Bacillus sp. S4]